MSDSEWFDQRPLITERCPRCKGCGEITRSYALAAETDDVRDAPADAIRAVVIGSFDIFTACREAAAIVQGSARPVAFAFLDHTVVVRLGDDPNLVARDWWQKQYGETPEETRARR